MSFFGDVKEISEYESLRCGGRRKFMVLKIADINANLNSDEIEELCKLANKVFGKKNHEYLVINTDEPYAPDVIEILKHNGHWK